MVRQGHGHIVNVASLGPIPGIALYSASKYAVRSFSLAAAQELRAHGVAVTTVCPDAVKTPMFDHQIAYREAALTFTAPRVLRVEEVSRVILGKVLAAAADRLDSALSRLAGARRRSPAIDREMARPDPRAPGLRRQKEWRESERS